MCLLVPLMFHRLLAELNNASETNSFEATGGKSRKESFLILTHPHHSVICIYHQQQQQEMFCSFRCEPEPTVQLYLVCQLAP